MSDDTEQKTLLLTGASRGIGHATGITFAQAGWRVLTCSRQPVSEFCPWQSGEENHIQVDLSNPKDLIAAAADIRDRLDGGPLHALVNNAGISPKGADGARLNSLDTDLSVWGQVFHVNFFASIVLALFGRFAAVSVPVSVLKPFRSFAAGTIPIMTWGGLKGGISVALALSLPDSEWKPLILTCTYMVVLFSIIVQGLTVARVASRLGREPELG